MQYMIPMPVVVFPTLAVATQQLPSYAPMTPMIFESSALWNRGASIRSCPIAEIPRGAQRTQTQR